MNIELSLSEGNFVGLPFVLSFLFSLNFSYISQVSHKRVKTSFSSRIYLHNKRSKMQAVKQKSLVFCVNDASHILFLIVK